MNTIYENDYLHIQVDEEKSLYLYKWKDIGKEMELSVFLHEASKLLENFINNPCKYTIADSTKLQVIIPPVVQEKMNKNILEKLNNTTLKKYAHIISSDLITELSQEQMFSENIKKTYEDKYFKTIEEANDWFAK